MSKLDAIRLKVQRANEHLEDFKDTVRGKRGTIYPPHGVGMNFQADRQRVAIHSHPVKPTQKVEWGIIVGDVIHQLRSTLDHLIYQLATRHVMRTEKQLRNLNFPICKDSRDFGALDMVSSGLLESMIGGNEFAEVIRAQPYERNPASPTSDELWILERLDDLDKHRTIFVLDNRVLIKMSADTEDGLYSHRFDIIKEPTKPETELFNIRWPHPVPATRVNMDNVLRFVVFNETDPLCDGAETIPLVRTIVDAVDETATEFDHFFP